MQLDHQAVTILKKVATEPGMSIKTLCEGMGLSPRNFYYRRSRINDWLVVKGFTPVSCSDNQGLRLRVSETDAILRLLGGLYDQSYKLSAEERRDHLLLHLSCNTRPLFTQQLSDINHVSRNTTLEDLHVLKTCLQEKHALTLAVSKKRGYCIVGPRLARRLCVQQLLQRSLKYADAQVENRISHVLLGQLSWLGVSAEAVQRDIDNGLQLTEHHLKRAFTDKDKRLLHYMVMFSLLDSLAGHHPDFTPRQTAFLREQPECEAAALLNNHLAATLNTLLLADNTLFFSLLLSASKHLNSQSTDSADDRRLVGCIQMMVEQFQALSGVYFSDISRLVSRLFAHLGPAIRRCVFEIHNENVLREEVSQRYPLIFRVCRQVIVTLEQEYRIAVSDDELSYIAVSFAAWLDRRPETGEQQILLLTEGGLSSTAILENQLRNLTVLPLNITHCSASQLQQQDVPADTRLIVSTIAQHAALPENVPFIRVQHMLTESQQRQLRRALENSAGAGRVTELVNALVDAAAQHIPSAKEQLQQTFSLIVSRFMSAQRDGNYAGTPLTLADHLHQRVQFSGRQLSWRQAIRTAASPLINEGIIGNHYVNQIVKNIENAGVTTYLTPQILLLHAAPPEGASSGALALLKMKQPLNFGRFAADLAPLLIVILVPSHDLSHIALLEALNVLIGDETALSALLKASSLPAVLDCIAALPVTVVEASA